MSSANMSGLKTNHNDHDFALAFTRTLLSYSPVPYCRGGVFPNPVHYDPPYFTIYCPKSHNLFIILNKLQKTTLISLYHDPPCYNVNSLCKFIVNLTPRYFDTVT